MRYRTPNFNEESDSNSYDILSNGKTCLAVCDDCFATEMEQ